MPSGFTVFTFIKLITPTMWITDKSTWEKTDVQNKPSISIVAKHFEIRKQELELVYKVTQCYLAVKLNWSVYPCTEIMVSCLETDLKMTAPTLQGHTETYYIWHLVLPFGATVFLSKCFEIQKCIIITMCPEIWLRIFYLKYFGSANSQHKPSQRTVNNHSFTVHYWMPISKT